MQQRDGDKDQSLKRKEYDKSTMNDITLRVDLRRLGLNGCDSSRNYKIVGK